MIFDGVLLCYHIYFIIFCNILPGVLTVCLNFFVYFFFSLLQKVPLRPFYSISLFWKRKKRRKRARLRVCVTWSVIWNGRSHTCRPDLNPKPKSLYPSFLLLLLNHQSSHGSHTQRLCTPQSSRFPLPKRHFLMRAPLCRVSLRGSDLLLHQLFTLFYFPLCLVTEKTLIKKWRKMKIFEIDSV